MSSDLVPRSEEFIERQYDLRAKFFQGLANPSRLRIIELLLERGEMNVGQLIEAVGMSQGQISNQLACLKWCGYVTSRGQGKHVYYRVADPRVKDLISLAQSLVADNAEVIRACTRMGQGGLSPSGERPAL